MEAGQAVLQADRQTRQVQGDFAVHRLSRHAAGRAGHHRHPGVQGAVRSADPRRFPRAQHQLLPGARAIRAPTPRRSGRYCADRIAEAIEFEGPDTVAAVFLEPVQNAGGCFPPPPGYFERVREICDEYDVLLVSDEVICAYGRIGSMFACDDFGYVPDIITCAKGLTSGYSPIGAMIASDRLFEPFNDGTTVFGHGYTFGGHPVSSAVALANLDIFEREGINDHVKENGARVPVHPGEALRPADRRRRPRRGLLLRHRTGQGQDHQGDVQRRGVRAAAARLPHARAVRGRAVLPRRRPRRPSRAVGAAADQRPEGVRRDLRHPARRAERSGQTAVGQPASVGGCLQQRKPSIDPVRWQPPPVDPLPDRPDGRRRRSLPCPATRPEDVVVDAAVSSGPGLDRRAHRAHRRRRLRARRSSATPAGDRWAGTSRATAGC